jgi:vacuolar-type H+-ATPase subunit E/Vma4
VEVLTMKKREQLEQLQVLLCDTYKESIEEMKETGDYNAALLNGARQLLKDNDVVSITEQGTPLGNLAEVLPFNEDDETKQAAQQS